MGLINVVDVLFVMVMTPNNDRMTQIIYIPCAWDNTV